MRCLGVVAVVLLGCSAAIEHGLDEPAANEVVTSLARAGIVASKNRDDGNSDAFVVTVAKADVVRSMELLQSLGLPRARRVGFGEVYRQGSLLPTLTEERAKYVEALSGEIVRTLETVDGVASARVHLVLPEADPLVQALAADGKPRVAAQAAVLLKTRAGRSQPIAEAEVRKLVAGSVTGLEPAAVAVVFTAAAECPDPTSGLVALGPLRMTARSRTIVIATAATASALMASLSVLLLVMARRLARRDGGG
jgi:type III secretion protein J